MSASSDGATRVEATAADPLVAALDAVEPPLLAPIEDTLATLHHDVGKYVTRVARNVPGGAEVPRALGAMLLKDLYETHKGTRASVRFAELVETLPRAVAELAPLRDAAAALSRIDAAEPAVRALEPEAVVGVVLEAREVERLLARTLRAVRLARARRGESDA